LLTDVKAVTSNWVPRRVATSAFVSEARILAACAVPNPMMQAITSIAATRRP
jgi:hypothetical protein